MPLDLHARHLILAAALGLSSTAASVPAPAVSLAAEETGLAASVRTRLLEDSHHLSNGVARSIAIDTVGAAVRLRGDVPTLMDRFLAGTLARSADGVRAVLNELTVSSEEPPYHGS